MSGGNFSSSSSYEIIIKSEAYSDSEECLANIPPTSFDIIVKSEEDSSSEFGGSVVVASGGNVSQGSLGGYEEIMANIPPTSCDIIIKSEDSSEECFHDDSFVSCFYDGDFGGGSEDKIISGAPNGILTSPLPPGEPSEVTGEGGRHGAGLEESLLSSNSNFGRGVPLSSSKIQSPSTIVPKPKINGKSPQIQEKFECSVCQKKFSHKQDSKTCEKSHLPWEELQKLSGFHAKCSCDKIFLHKRDYKRHMDSHEGRKDHSCRKCQRGFGQKSDLIRHQIIHMDEKEKSKLKKSWKNICYFCPMKFSAPSYLYKHLARHTKESPFICDLCHKRFTEKRSLSRHEKQHEANRARFGCSICAKSFTQKADLKRHEATVHLRLKPHSCPKCQRGFGQKGDLNKHFKTCN